MPPGALRFQTFGLRSQELNRDKLQLVQWDASGSKPPFWIFTSGSALPECDHSFMWRPSSGEQALFSGDDVNWDKVIIDGAQPE
jgi:hypothetical protein